MKNLRRASGCPCPTILRFEFTCILATVAMIFAINNGCSRSIPEHLKDDFYRPGQVDQAKLKEKVKKWSLSLNGVAFENAHHTFRNDEQIELTGRVTFAEGAIESGMLPEFRVTLRPIGVDEAEDWQQNGLSTHDMEFYSSIIHGTVEKRINIDAKYFPAGDYTARLYFFLEDMNEDESSVYLLSTAKVTIIDGTSPEES